MKLVFIHGRAQEDKDPLVLRQRWVSALQTGLATAGLELPIDERDIVFPFYGDALRDATTDGSEQQADVRFPLREHADELTCPVLRDCLEQIGINDEVVAAHAAQPTADLPPVAGHILSLIHISEPTRR